MSSELMTVGEAARRLKLSESYLNKLRMTGGGPRFVRVGRSIRYREDDLGLWLDGKTAESTSEYDAAGA